ncbi:MAG: hypothetical protein JXL80_09795 [Planctomycetes bacterium]|nr:hypothetical protein [Planctomycetota bacterium]
MKTAIPVPEDKSLTIGEYIEAGVPDCGRDWLSADVQKAAEALAAIESRQPGSLPRCHSQRSGRLFDRITSCGNLQILTDHSQTILVRMQLWLGYSEAANRITKLYLAAFAAGQVADEEMIEMSRTTLSTMAIGMDLVDEFLPTLDKNDPTYAVRMEGLEKFRAGAAHVVMGCLIVVDQPEYYREELRGRLLEYMKETCPSILRTMTPNARKETLVTVQRMMEEPGLAALRGQLAEIRALIEEADRVAP